ncbi:MAG TPA: hypothetical protein VKX17_27750 [Planctomycetota bacterium]|nr:hypothetical protein [Planctomycetota bacterium]
MPLDAVKNRLVEDPKSCWFYHVMDLPGYGTTTGEWDLRNTFDDYIGRFDLKGKRVLDAGAASGFCSFQMEARGATVVSFDMEDGYYFDLVPFYTQRDKFDARRKDIRVGMETAKNGYWFAHRLLGSKAIAYYGTVYNIPPEVGQFDVVVMGQILVHLRDPFAALASASARCGKTLIIIEALHNDPGPVAQFHPKAGVPAMDHSWWKLSAQLYREMLGILGFQISSITYSKHRCTANGKDEELATIIANR